MLAEHLSPEEIEAALIALAALYENSNDNTGDYLSEQQQEIAERILSLSAEAFSAAIAQAIASEPRGRRPRRAPIARRTGTEAPIVLLASEHMPTARLEPMPSLCTCPGTHLFLVTWLRSDGAVDVGAHSDDRARDLAAGRLVAAGVTVGRHNIHLDR